MQLICHWSIKKNETGKYHAEAQKHGKTFENFKGFENNQF